MKLFPHSLVLSSLLAILMTSGCSDPASPGSQLPTGTLVGNVTLYRIKGQITDHSGIKVTLEENGMTTVTDKFGEFRFDDVPTSTYTVIYEKEGYGPMKQPMVSFLGGSIVRIANISMSAIPRCGTVFDDVRQVDTFYVEAHARPTCSDLDSQSSFIYDFVLFAFSNSPDVSAEPEKHKFAIIGNTPAPRGTASIYVTKQQLEQYLNIDDSIYVAAFNVGGGGWVDPLTQRTFYTSYNLEHDRVLAFKWHKE
jgi:hypothetical protein